MESKRLPNERSIEILKRTSLAKTGPNQKVHLIGSRSANQDRHFDLPLIQFRSFFESDKRAEKNIHPKIYSSDAAFASSDDFHLFWVGCGWLPAASVSASVEDLWLLMSLSGLNQGAAVEV